MNSPPPPAPPSPRPWEWLEQVDGKPGRDYAELEKLYRERLAGLGGGEYAGEKQPETER